MINFVDFDFRTIVAVRKLMVAIFSLLKCLVSFINHFFDVKQRLKLQEKSKVLGNISSVKDQKKNTQKLAENVHYFRSEATSMVFNELVAFLACFG